MKNAIRSYRILFACYFALTCFTAHPQAITDSLLKALKKTHQMPPGYRTDTIKASILYKLGRAYWSNDPAIATDYTMQLLRLSQQRGYLKGIGLACTGMGNIYWHQGIFDSALVYQYKALAIQEKEKDRLGIAATYNSLGNIYADQANYTEALNYYIKSLKLCEEIKDKKGLAKANNNLGIIYQSQGNYKQAFQHYDYSLRLKQELGDKKGMINSYTNLGIVKEHDAKISEALAYFEHSLQLAQETDDLQGIARAYNNIGRMKREQHKPEEALKNHFKALDLFKQLDQKYNIANSHSLIGKVLFLRADYNQAKAQFEQALQISKQMNSLELMKTAYADLSACYEKMGKFREAFYHALWHKQLYDSLYNLENEKQFARLEIQYEYDKKTLSDSIRHAEEKKVTEAQMARQRAIISSEKVKRNGFIAGTLLMSILALVSYRSFTRKKKDHQIISREKQRSEELLLNILPEEIAEELKEKGEAEARLIPEATVLFTDFKGFTAMSEKLSPKELVKDLHECFSAFDRIVEKYNLEKIKTIGDSYMAAGGLPVPHSSHAADAVKAALEMRNFIEDGKALKQLKGLPFFEVRIGIHTGPVVAGIVGVKKFAYDIWGDTVNTASRMESSGEAGKVNISGATFEMVKSNFNCTYRGKISAKGKGEIDMYFVEEKADNKQENQL